MSTHHRISISLRTLTAVIALLAARPAGAQTSPAGLAPEIAPLTAKYQSDMEALSQARDKAAAQPRQTYLNALAAAQQKAASEKKQDEAKAVADEASAVTAGSKLAAVPSPLLPRALTTPRSFYLREAARAEHEYSAHAQQIGAEYLRGLAFYESKATAAGQTDLLKQIQTEKLKVTAQGAAPRSAHGAGQSVIANGDFAEKKADGTPATWQGGGPGKGAVTTEQSVTFLRMVSTGKAETWFIQNVDRPANVQQLEVSVRLRSPDFKGVGPYGIVIAQRDAANNLVARDTPCVLKAPCPVWKAMTGMVTIHPETTKLIIRCNMVDCSATVDFADVRVEAR